MLKILLHSPVKSRYVGYGTLFENLARFIRLSDNAVTVKAPDFADVELYLGQPFSEYENDWERKHPLHRGIFTMFESRLLPAGWVDNINGAFDFLVVPSQWCADIFAANGIQVPIYVVPLGVDTSIWRQPKLRPPKVNLFNILWVGTYVGDRKGGDIIQRVFEKIRRPDWRLWLKANPSYTKYRAQCNLANPDGRRLVIDHWWTELMLAHLEYTDVSVNPTRAEGFGLIPLEHAACGVPTIVTDTSGCKEFADPRFFFLLPARPASEKPTGIADGMDTPDEDTLASHLIWIYEHREEARAMAAQGAEWIAENFSYEKTASRLIQILFGELWKKTYTQKEADVQMVGTT